MLFLNSLIKKFEKLSFRKTKKNNLRSPYTHYSSPISNYQIWKSNVCIMLIPFLFSNSCCLSILFLLFHILIYYCLQKTGQYFFKITDYFYYAQVKYFFNMYLQICTKKIFFYSLSYQKLFIYMQWVRNDQNTPTFSIRLLIHQINSEKEEIVKKRIKLICVYK